MVKRIPESLVNIAKRFRSSVDGDYCYPDDVMSTTFSPAKLGPSINGNKSLRENTAHLAGFKHAHDDYDDDDDEEEEDTKMKPTQFKEEGLGLAKLLMDDLQSDIPDKVTMAAREICDLLSIAAPLQEKVHEDFMKLGGHTCIVLTMKKWTKVASIQSELIHCVGRMVILHGGASGPGAITDLVSSFVEMEGVHLIYKAMVTFRKHPALQINCMFALANLCSKFEAAPSAQAAKRFVLDLEGVSLVTKAMKSFPEHEMVQENGCWLLNNLCNAGGRQTSQIIKEKALMVVAASVQHFPDNDSIESDARDLMETVLSGDKKSEHSS